MKTTNALVTYTDLTTMGLVAKGTPATGNRIATKSFINSNYYVNQSASPYSTFSSLRCPPYQTIIAGPTNSGTLYYLTTGSYPGNYGGFTTCTAACNHTTGGSVTVYWYGTLGFGTYIYMDPDGIVNFDGGDLFSLNGYCLGFDASAVISIDACSTATAAVDITNATSTASITNVTVNGVAITDVTFPITAGNSANGLTTQIGTYTIVVSYSSASGDYVSVTDDTPTTTCANATGSSRTFTSQVVTSSIYIEMGDGACP
jgi:hypothetical protein